MRKLNSWAETAATGRVVLEMDDGTVLDTDAFGGSASGPTVTQPETGVVVLTTP